ncbi:hypothetical protein QJS66_14860 [Kocuria rhizophila]|nr:hypothetical protein QJS66_14860 [Kocuria rhizophila]
MREARDRPDDDGAAPLVWRARPPPDLARRGRARRPAVRVRHHRPWPPTAS